MIGNVFIINIGKTLRGLLYYIQYPKQSIIPLINALDNNMIAFEYLIIENETKCGNIRIETIANSLFLLSGLPRLKVYKPAGYSLNDLLSLVQKKLQIPPYSFQYSTVLERNKFLDWVN